MKQEKKQLISLRLYKSLLKEIYKIILDLENQYAYGNKTVTGVIETAIIRYVDYYWRRRKREKANQEK